MISKNAFIGLVEGVGVGVYSPMYLAKRISRKDFYSIGETIDQGGVTATDTYVNRDSTEYKIMKNIGKGLGVPLSIPALPVSLAFDLAIIMSDRELKRKKDC